MNNDNETIELPWESESADATSDSTPLTHDELESRISDWCKSQNTPYDEDGRKRSADARRLIISCPKGSF